MLRFTDIENVFKQRNWWDLILNLKAAKYLTYFFANKTSLTPNQATFISFLLSIIAGILFLKQKFILGAIIYQISYIFDIVDGALARVTNKTSKIGAFLDVLTDWFKAPLLIAILLLELKKVDFLIIILFLFFINCCINKYNDMIFFTTKKSLTNQKEIKKSTAGKYFDFMKQKHIQPLPGIIEIEASLLFFYPIFQNDIFLYLGIFLLIFNFLLKLFVILKKLK